MEKSISKLNLENPIIKENFIKSLNEKKDFCNKNTK
jgi:hypothetical protein